MAIAPPPQGQIYDSIASDYDIIWSLPALQILLPLLENTLNSLGPWEGKAVLDMACGTGIGLRQMKKLGATTLVGVDISASMLEVARTTTPSSDSAPITLHHADCSTDLSHTGLTAGTFDLVLGMWLLNYPESRQGMKGMWSNIATYLAPGGKFVGIIQNQDTLHPTCMQGKLKEFGAQETEVRELENGDGWKMHVEFDTEPKVDIDTFVLKKELLEEEAEKAGMKGLRYVRAGDEVKGVVEGKSEEWWEEILGEYPNQVVVAEKA